MLSSVNYTPTPSSRITNTQIAKDESDAIDRGNIISGRTRGAAPSGGYREPGDDEGLPSDDGTSSN